MNGYHPASRRHIAPVFRAASRFAVDYCVRARIHPDAISYSSIVAAALCAACFWQAAPHPVLLLIAPLLAYLRLWFNMLDGMVALAGEKASPRGEIVNELPDRVSDVLIFAGVAHSGLNMVISGYWAAIFAVLTAYVGTLGHAVAGRREFGGLMSKPFRMVLLHGGAWATLGLHAWNDGQVTIGPMTALDWMCVLIVAGCVQTIFARLRRTLGLLQQRVGGVEGQA